MSKGSQRRAAAAPQTTDSFQNFLAGVGLGAGSQNDGSRYGLGPVISRDRVQLESAYRNNWLCGMVVDIVADDMTRAGIDITADMEPETVGKLTRAFDRYRIWDELGDAIKWSRLYGGAIAVMLIDGHKLSQPLDVSKIDRKQFRGMYVLDRWQLDTTFSVNDLVTDIGPHMGKPKFYRVQQNATAFRGETIHHSRVIRFDGVKMPYNVRQIDNFWGASVLERLYDRLVAFDSTTLGAAQLVYKAHLRTYKVSGLRDIIATGGPALAGLMKQIEMVRQFQSNEGLTLMDATDEFEAHSYTFSGLDNVLLQFGQQLSGATQIPLIRLFGQSPAGLNSSGDSDLRTYYDNISKEQNRALRSGLSTLLALLCRSEIGEQWPEDADFEFRSLWQMTDEQKASVTKTLADAVVAVENAGIISQATALKELRAVAARTGTFGHITQEDIDSAATEPPAPMDENAPGDTTTATTDAFDTFDADGEHWITLENGEHVLLDGSGHVIGGAGGNMNGMKLSPKSKSPDVSKPSASDPSGRIARLGEHLNKVQYTPGKAKANLAAIHKSLSEIGHSVEIAPMGSHLRAPVAAVNPQTKHMRLNSEHPFWKDPEEFATAMHESGISASPHRMHIVAHELGHLEHSLPKESAAFSPEESVVAAKVSRYASSNKNEFLAEYVAGKVGGASYDPDVESLYRSIATSASASSAPERPFDHGELNIPGRTKNINAELDRYKKEQAAKAHAEHKSLVAAGRERKSKINAILGHNESMTKYAAKFGKTPKQIGELIKGMMPKQQDLFIAAHEREYGKIAQ